MRIDMNETRKRCRGFGNSALFVKFQLWLILIAFLFRMQIQTASTRCITSAIKVIEKNYFRSLHHPYHNSTTNSYSLPRIQTRLAIPDPTHSQIGLISISFQRRKL
jgi:hypothetical protein